MTAPGGASGSGAVTWRWTFDGTPRAKPTRPVRATEPPPLVLVSQFWARVKKFDRRSSAIADKHYSRRTIGSPQFMPPGETQILMTREMDAVFGWWRPHPDSGLESMNGLDGWTCTIFRNEGPRLSSLLILDAEQALRSSGVDCGPDGLISYVWAAKIRSANPGCCFKKAGWKQTGLSKDKRKLLFQKPFGLST